MKTAERNMRKYRAEIVEEIVQLLDALPTMQVLYVVALCRGLKRRFGRDDVYQAATAFAKKEWSDQWVKTSASQ